MHLRLLLPFMLVVPCAAEAQPARRAYPEVTIPNTELRSLHSSVTSRDYDLYVYLPSRLDPSSGRKYPVLYLLDGQWDFKLLASIHGGLLYDRFVPGVIVVGITYSGPDANYDSLRAVDYTPKASPSNAGSGQGAKFRAFLETELMPFIEWSYPADPARRGLNVFAAAPGGVLIISPEGKHLGTIVTGQPTANCAFGDDGSTLYITANNQLMRVRLRTKGAGFN